MQLSSVLLAGAGKEMTSQFSLTYLTMFLPICILAFLLTPQKLKKYALLIESLAFFWLISGKLVAYIILSALAMHYFGIWLDTVQKRQRQSIKELPKDGQKAIKKQYGKKQNAIVALSVALLAGTLLVLKYTPFFTVNVNALFSLLKLNVQLDIPNYLMPVGISFFTLQAMSYIIDVRRGVVKADWNLLRLMLFICFFPQIVEGPIVRYNQTASALWNVEQISFPNFRQGAFRFMYGMIKKLVIADRLNPFVAGIFDKYSEYEGGIIAIGAIAYTVQLYMDFSGSMDAVIGTAKIFGITLPENFNQPFFSKSISEFWQRWHITLGTWFKDYIFLPVTGVKRMKELTSCARKKLGNCYGPLVAGGIALFLVWLANGLWHGSAWKYIFFGMYHFVLILSGNIIRPISRSAFKKLKIKNDNAAVRIIRIVRTGLLVVVGELFFRANGLRAGIAMFSNMIKDFRFSTLNFELIKKLGIDRYDCLIVLVTLIIIFAVSLIKEKGVDIIQTLEKKNTAVRWGISYAMIIYLVVFGAYGIGYAAVDPLYAQF